MVGGGSPSALRPFLFPYALQRTKRIQHLLYIRYETYLFHFWLPEIC